MLHWVFLINGCAKDVPASMAVPESLRIAFESDKLILQAIAASGITQTRDQGTRGQKGCCSTCTCMLRWPSQELAHRRRSRRGHISLDHHSKLDQGKIMIPRSCCCTPGLDASCIWSRMSMITAPCSQQLARAKYSSYLQQMTYVTLADRKVPQRPVSTATRYLSNRLSAFAR